MKKIKYFFLAFFFILAGLFLGIYYREFSNSNTDLQVKNKRQISKKSIEISKNRQSNIINAVNEVIPSVVSIKTRYKQKEKSDLYRKFFEEFFGHRRDNKDGYNLGSGAIISKDGLVLTANHVVQAADEIIVTLPDGREFDAKILGSDYLNDLALLKINGNNLPFIKLGNSDTLLPGEWVIALGNPFGLMVSDPQPTVTVGVVSAIMRTLSFKNSNPTKMYGIIQTDAAINPGNSGGPLINANGEIIGINNSIFSTSGGSQGIGFVVPINNAKKSIDDIMDFGEVKRGWLGIYIKDIPYKVRKKHNLGIKKGVIVNRIFDKYDKIEAGDIILSFNNKPVKNKKWWKGYLLRLTPEENVSLKIWDGSEIKQIEVKPDKFNYGKFLNKFGLLKLRSLTYNDAYKYNVRTEKGLIIKDINKDSMLYNKNVRKNDILRGINNIRIYDKKDLKMFFNQNMYEHEFKFIFERQGYF